MCGFSFLESRSTGLDFAALREGLRSLIIDRVVRGPEWSLIGFDPFMRTKDSRIADSQPSLA